MTAPERKPVDRSTFGPGPWDGEPDRLEWRTAAGLPALARRTEMGHWCGYVAVPPGHALHGVSAGSVVNDGGVHGGLTYAARCQDEICHVPAPGEPDDVWWFGFDCAHSFDMIPAHPFPDLGWRTYKTLDFVRGECERLAAALLGGA